MRYSFLCLIFLLSNIVFAGETKRIPDTIKVLDIIKFEDDLDLVNMKLAVKRQMVYFKRANLDVKFKFGSDSYSRKDLKSTLESFIKLADTTIACLKNNSKDKCYQHFSKIINAEYNIYKPKPLSWEQGQPTNKSLFTAYYSPDFHGSRTKTAVYKNPIYKLPKSSKLRYLSREDIDFDGKLADKGLVLFYVKENLYDIWLLHVEGGGRVQVENNDGSIESVYLSYAGTNKQSFNMLYKYMLANNMLKPGKTGINSQRAYLNGHPNKQREVFSSCPSYIYFTESMKEPVGVHNMILTENRSLASDYRIYKEYGILNFIKAKRPKKINGTVQFVNFSRFFINQDTGGGIKGNARSDLYFGFGPEAELSANNLKVLGNQYFLIKKY